MTSIANAVYGYIKTKPALFSRVKGLANRYTALMGYRRIGLKLDDLIVDENPEVQKAISRLSAKEAYDRAYRLRVAFQATVRHDDLPKEQQMKPEDDKPYLRPVLDQVLAEKAEREKWDAISYKTGTKVRT